MLKKVFSEFGYRLNSLSAETFFSDGVFLVEGTSEVLFYTALAEELGLDTDRHNVSILSVEGVGFKPYVAICNALNIPWILRTDNDIFSKPKNAPTKKYYAGITRIMGIIEEIGDCDTGLIAYWKSNSDQIEWPKDDDIPVEAEKLKQYVGTAAEALGVFLSDIDLENDLVNSEIFADLSLFYGEKDHEAIVKRMQKKKAENMLSFLSEHHDKLGKLKDNKIFEPLSKLITTITEKTRPNNDKRTN